jgi:hypothetical protein
LRLRGFVVRFSGSLSNQTNAERITRLKITLALAFLCGFLLSPKLWLSTRVYPLAPVAKILPALPFPLDYLAFALLLLLLVGIVFRARPRKLIATFVVLGLLVCLWDQTRWQPWCYQYVFMSLVLACYSWRADDEGGRESALNACAVVVAGVYFWSGLQKVNPLFTGELFPSLVEPYVRHLPASFGVASRWVAPLVPLAEVGVGVGLLSRKFRTHAVCLALVLHLSVLILFVPVRRNTVVWGWNAAMICFVVLLFLQRQEPSLLRQALAGKGRVLTTLAVLLFWVMPLFNFFGYWDAYLSSSLYSGKTMYGYVEVGAEVKERLPPVAQSYTRTRADGGLLVDVTRWSFGELNVPPYPAARVYKNVADKICAYATRPTEVVLELHDEPPLFSRVRNVRGYECPAH